MAKIYFEMCVMKEELSLCRLLFDLSIKLNTLPKPKSTLEIKKKNKKKNQIKFSFGGKLFVQYPVKLLISFVPREEKAA